MVGRAASRQQLQGQSVAPPPSCGIAAATINYIHNVGRNQSFQQLAHLMHLRTR